MSKGKTVPGISPRADWRDPAIYQPLLELDRAGWAGEFLKRNPGFIAAVEQFSNPPRSTVRSPKRPRVIEASTMQTLERWGLLFHRKFRLREFLVSRMQPAGAGCRGFAHRVRPCRRF